MPRHRLLLQLHTHNLATFYCFGYADRYLCSFQCCVDPASERDLSTDGLGFNCGRHRTGLYSDLAAFCVVVPRQTLEQKDGHEQETPTEGAIEEDF